MTIKAKEKNIPTYQIKHLKRAIHPLEDMMAFFEILRLLKILKPDIIHTNSSKAGVLGSLAGKIYGCRVVFTAHGFQYLEPNTIINKSFFKLIEKIASGFRDHIITVSKSDNTKALRDRVCSPNATSNIYNGSSLVDFIDRTKARQLLRIDESKEIIGVIANHYKTKGLDILIKAVSMLPKSVTDKCDIILIGEGPETPELKRQIKMLGLTNIYCLGSIRDAARFLTAFDIFILPSRKEGFPYALIEAMQAGLPIIATNVGGNSELLADSGIIITPERPKELADAIEMLISSPEIKKQLSADAKIRSRIFKLERMIEETGKVYSQVLYT